MPYQPTVNFKLSDGRDLGSLGWITKEYLMTVYPQIAANMITPELWVWGFNTQGQLGINVAGATTNRTTPVTTFSGGANWKQVANGNNHAAAIKTDGTLWTWGYGLYGNLGIDLAGTIVKRCTPVTTSVGGTNWKQVDAGYFHTAAIKTDGTLWTWGRNDFGQLGINDTNMRCTPVTVFGSATNWKQVACGREHTTAIKADGSLWTWGYNKYGQLGINNTTNILTPVTTFLGGKNWKQVASKYYYTVAIQSIDIL